MPHLLHVLFPKDIRVRFLHFLFGVDSFCASFIISSISKLIVWIGLSFSSWSASTFLTQLGKLREEALVGYDWLELFSLGVDPGLSSLELRLRLVVPQVELKVKLARVW